MIGTFKVRLLALKLLQKTLLVAEWVCDKRVV